MVYSAQMFKSLALLAQILTLRSSSYNPPPPPSPPLPLTIDLTCTESPRNIGLINNYQDIKFQYQQFNSLLAYLAY